MENKRMTNRQISALETKESIIKSAKKLIKEKGFENVSVLDITNDCNVSKGTFYTYFKQKEDIIQVLVNNNFKEIQKIALAKEESFIDKLNYFLIEFMKSIENDGIKLANQWVKNEVDNLNEYLGFNGPKYEYDLILVKDILEDAVKRSELKEDTPVEELSRILIYQIYGILLCWCIMNGNYKMEEEINKFCDYAIKEIFKKYLI